jgi:hypothetical protein
MQINTFVRSFANHVFVFLCPLKCMWAAIGIGSGPIYSWDSNSKPYVFQKEMQSGSEAYLVNSGCAC